MAGRALPFKAYSDGELNGSNKTWSRFNYKTVPLPVIARKAYFSVPANELPDNVEPYGSVWKQHLGQITYFTPGIDISPAWVCVYLKFLDNFVGQRVRIILNNSDGDEPTVLQDWTAVSLQNGSFLPVFQVCQLTKLKAKVNYWVEVHFEKTTFKAAGFYGEDGIAGFNSKYWWSISEAPISDIYKYGDKTDVITGKETETKDPNAKQY